MQGTLNCIICGKSLVANKPNTDCREVCCTDADYSDGSYESPRCTDCCDSKHTYRPWPVYERMDCD